MTPTANTSCDAFGARGRGVVEVLRGHVLHGAGTVGGRGQLVAVVGVAREAEVDQRDRIVVVPLGEHRVRGLQVVVNDAALVHVVQRVGDVARHTGGALGVGKVHVEAVFEGAAQQVLHHDALAQVGRATLVGRGHRAVPVDRDDVRVVERQPDVGLAREPGRGDTPGLSPEGTVPPGGVGSNARASRTRSARTSLST
jgi:nitrogen regulatory protein PII